MHEVLDGSLLDTPKHKRLLRVRKEPRTALTTGTTRGRSYDVQDVPAAPQKMPRTEPVRPSVIASPVAMRVALLGRCGLREPNATGASGRSLEDFLGDEALRPTRIGELAA